MTAKSEPRFFSELLPLLSLRHSEVAPYVSSRGHLASLRQVGAGSYSELAQEALPEGAITSVGKRCGAGCAMVRADLKWLARCVQLYQITTRP